MVRLPLAFLLMLLASMLGTAISSAGAQELSVGFEEELAIGDGENLPRAYLFSGPEFILTDSEERIYVATRNEEIRVFNPQGEHLKTIGRRGKGPGEFQSISGMTFGYDGELIVNDQQADRITWFYHLGDSSKMMRLDHPYYLGADLVRLNNHDQQFATTLMRPSWVYELVAKYKEIDFEPINDENRVVYIYNHSFTERSEALFNVYSHMFDRENPLEEDFAQEGYRMVSLNEGTLAITHENSDGSLYLLDVESGQVREVRGHFSGREYYEKLEWSRRNSYWEERNSMVVLGGGRDMVYQRKMSSIALVANEKWVLNFLQVSKGDQSTIYMEFLDKRGNYLGYTTISDDFDSFTTSYSDFLDATINPRTFAPRHLDDRDRLYYVDYSSGIPIIRVTKIMME